MLTVEEKEEAPVAVEAIPETCLNNSGPIMALAVVIVTLLVPVVILIQKIKGLKKNVPTSEMSKLESSNSKKQLNIRPDDSVEMNLNLSVKKD